MNPNPPGAYNPTARYPSVTYGPNNRYKIAFVEFGEDGFSQDASQLGIARGIINAPSDSHPLVVVYVHGWQNNADSADVCRFERFVDALSRNELINSHHLKVIGVYLAWRGKSLDVDYVNALTFWNREQVAHKIANAVPPANNPRARDTLSQAVDVIGSDIRHKKASYKGGGTPPFAILLGHSFGALVLEESISRDIESAIDNVSGKTITWDLAVALNSANDSQNSRQLEQNFNDFYRHEGNRYISKIDPTKSFPDYRTALISVTSETDDATGLAFPLGSWIGGLFKARLLRDDDISNAQTQASESNGKRWRGGWFARLPIPGDNQRTAWRGEFATTTPGHNKDLINFRVDDLGGVAKGEIPNQYKTAFDLNIGRNRENRIFYTSEENLGQELKICKDAHYCPPSSLTGTGAAWHKWQIVPANHPMTPYWIFTVRKSIINGHGGIWSDNSIALLGALYRMQTPLTATAHGAQPIAPPPIPLPPSPELKLRQYFSLPVTIPLK